MLREYADEHAMREGSSGGDAAVESVGNLSWHSAAVLESVVGLPGRGVRG